MTLDEAVAAIVALSDVAEARRDAHEAGIGALLSSDSRFVDRWFTLEERIEFARLQQIRTDLEPTTEEIRARVREKRALRRARISGLTDPS